MPVRKKLLKMAGALLSLMLCLSACGGALPDHAYQIDIEPYEKALASKGKDYLYLVNKSNPCGETYAPAELATLPVELTLYAKEVQLEATAALAAEALVLELHARGYEDIVVTSGYRSYEYQQILFNTYLGNEQKKHPDWTTRRCREEVLTYSANPGESEHQTGLCLDLISQNRVVLDESFAQNPAYGWLVENAHHFGFILRYPQGKEGITGYAYEPWHYRFVGVEAATEIYRGELTLEEYLD